MTDSLKKKVQFVNEISEAIVKVQTNVTSIQYRIFNNLEYKNYTKEYLVVNYKGGARTVRICSGNSYSAIFEEISKYLDRGYYAEEYDLYDIEQHPEVWQEEVI